MKNKFKFFGILAVALVLSLAFAGCKTDDSDDDSGGGGGPTATIKLEQDGVNTVKLTLSGATWKEDEDALANVLHSNSYLTEWNKISGDTGPLDDEPISSCYTYERVSDTELKAVIAYFNNGFNVYTFEGSVKLKTDAELAKEESFGTLGAMFLYNYTNEGKFDDGAYKALGTLTVAEGSQTVNIDTTNDDDDE